MPTSFFPSLISYSSDSLFELLLFLSGRDCCLLGATSKELHEFISQDKLWIIFCKTRIIGFRNYLDSNTQFQYLKGLLKFDNYQQLYFTFRYLKFPLFGWFRLLPPNFSDCFGGLYCVYPRSDHIYCQYINHQGIGHDDERSFLISFENRKNCVLSHAYDQSKHYKMKFSEILEFFRTLHPTESSPMSQGYQFNERLVMKPLPSLLSPSIVTNSTAFESFFPAIGLFTSRYGSHGIEILHLSLHSTEDPSALHFNNFQFNGLQLQALKITGDKNVPAGQLSFVIDILNTMDIVVPFVQDTRPIIMFPPDRTNPVLINWQQRIPNMQFFARGLGQINRVPGTWNPEWVLCGFVFYKSPMAETETVFSIVWDDENDHFRHAMDFRALSTGTIYPAPTPTMRS